LDEPTYSASISASDPATVGGARPPTVDRDQLIETSSHDLLSAGAARLTSLDQLPTPSLVLDRGRMARNIERMAARAAALGVPLRPHGKTPKSADVARQLEAAGAVGLTVSTLREAEYYSAAGFADLFYAVALAPQKVGRVAALIRRGADIKCLVDHPDAAAGIAAAAAAAEITIPLVIEIDVDGYRTGIAPGSAFVELGRSIHAARATRLAGIMSYGGASYNCTPEEAADLAERHRLALVAAQAELHAAGLPCGMVSFGSSPAVMAARSMAGITELRCGIYVFQDLFQAAIGACGIEDIALSVLSSVIAVRPDLNRIVIDAGGMAMSKDLSTSRTAHDAGYGLVCDARTGALIEDVHVAATSQELGLLATFGGRPLPFDRLGIGEQVRILPNHSDMTAAAYDEYAVVDGGNEIVARWHRQNGW